MTLLQWSWPTHRHQAVTAIARKAYLPHPHSSRSSSGQANGRIARAGRPHGLDPMPRRETAPRSCPGGPTPTPPGIRRSAISCPSGLSLSCRMPSARTSLGEVRTRRRSPTRRWSERVSEASRILPKRGCASVSAAWPPGELPDQAPRPPRGRIEGATGVRDRRAPRPRRDGRVPDDGDAAHSCGAYMSSLIDCLCRFRSCPRCSSRSPWGWLLARPQTDSSARSTGVGVGRPPGSETAFDRRRATQRHR